MASASAGTVPVPPFRLEAGNFNLWKGIVLPNLAGAGLHRHLDATAVVPAKTITEGDGDKAVTIPNPQYDNWWTQDQRLIGLLLGSMEPNIANQLIGCQTAAAVWAGVHDLYGAQSRANVRHIRRQLVTTRKEDLSAAAYMQKMKGYADAMAAAGAPITDDELVDYIVIGLGSAYNPVTASHSRGSDASVPYATFYADILSFESLQAQQAQNEGWSSSVNAAVRPNPTFPSGGFPRPNGGDGQQGQPRPGGNTGGYGRNEGGGYGCNDGGGYGRNDGGGYGRNDGSRNGGNGGGWNNNGRNGGQQQRRWRPKCQICGNWGHVAKDCRNRFDANFQPPQQKSGNAATTNYNNNP
jgi:hypothetical protein